MTEPAEGVQQMRIQTSLCVSMKDKNARLDMYNKYSKLCFFIQAKAM